MSYSEWLKQEYDARVWACIHTYTHDGIQKKRYEIERKNRISKKKANKNNKIKKIVEENTIEKMKGVSGGGRDKKAIIKR
mmetsp:Transcript_4059/g.7879  ORF Transcript_4059/g.7879 Transcript_4059/m.7879 type:complete len:80 (-) Transcript_4059:1887-2126(-)